MTAIEDADFDFDGSLRDVKEWAEARRDRLRELADTADGKAERGQLLARIGELDEVIEEIDERLGS